MQTVCAGEKKGGDEFCRVVEEEREEKRRGRKKRKWKWRGVEYGQKKKRETASTTRLQLRDISPAIFLLRQRYHLYQDDKKSPFALLARRQTKACAMESLL
jgi:hypothetical protein